MTIQDINTDTREGKLLMTALAILTVSRDITIDGKKINGRECGPDEMLNLVVKQSKRSVLSKG